MSGGCAKVVDLSTMRATLGMVHLWSVWLTAGGATAATVALRRYYLERLARERGRLLELGPADIEGWLTGAGWSPNTMKSARSAVRSFYAWAEATGRCERSPAAGLPRVRVPRGRARPTPETAYREALERADPRTRLAVELAGRCGLRRGEVARVRGGDVEDDLVGRSLRVTGKGGHVRLVPLPEDLARALVEAGPGWVFPSPRGGHLTPHHVAKLVRAVMPPGLTMHTLRHRCATTAYAATRDLRAVQELLGHSRPETTAGYVLTGREAVRAAMEAAAA